jgi:hypothetical protein
MKSMTIEIMIKKKLSSTILFLLITLFSYSQNKEYYDHVKETLFEGAKSKDFNKDLSKYMFNYFNTYRDSLKLGKWKWNDSLYDVVKNYSAYAIDSAWKHSSGTGKYFAFELMTADIFSIKDINNFEKFSKQCLNNFLNSCNHKGFILSKVKTKNQEKQKIILCNDFEVDTYIGDNGAISCVIIDRGDKVTVTCIVKINTVKNTSYIGNK